MPSFSRKSKLRLDTCDYQIQRLFNDVIKTYDCTIIEGHRSPDRQLELYEAGQSKVKRGKHNESPSLAVDAAPWVNGKIPWPGTQKDYWQFVHFAGYVQATAAAMGIDIRWGGDWDRDHDFSDQTFDDLVHFEVMHVS